MRKEDFVFMIEESNVNCCFDDLLMFADNYFCDGESFERNKEEFINFLRRKKE